MPKGQSLYHRFPDYRVDLEPSDRRVRVQYNGETIADSERVLVVRETRHHPVLYFPRDDVRLEHLAASEHHSVCPFKGEASYWSIDVGGRREADAVWSYEDPFVEVEGLRAYMAFYADRVEWDPPEAAAPE